MNALHQACARAIAGAQSGVKYTTPDLRDKAAATAAIRVCLAEAQRAIEARLVCCAHGCTASAPFCEGEGCWSVHGARDEALAVLAALAEEQA